MARRFGIPQSARNKPVNRQTCSPARNQRMLGYEGPAQPSPTLGDALNAGYGYMEVRCLGCDTHQTVDLDVVRRPKTEGEEVSELDPTPELPDDTPVELVRLPTRIKNVLKAAELKTVGAVRDTPDRVLLTFQDLGPGSVAHLRETLGLAWRDGEVRQALDLGLKAKGK